MLSVAPALANVAVDAAAVSPVAAVVSAVPCSPDEQPVPSRAVRASGARTNAAVVKRRRSRPVLYPVLLMADSSIWVTVERYRAVNCPARPVPPRPTLPAWRTAATSHVSPLPTHPETRNAPGN